jgi:hypothetical protein
MTDEKREELKECPFCGDGARLRCALWPSEGDTDGITHANPTECPAEGFSIGTADDGVSVTAAWNRRPPPASYAGAEKEDSSAAGAAPLLPIAEGLTASEIAERRAYLEKAAIPFMAAGIDLEMGSVANRAADAVAAKERRALARKYARGAFSLIPHFMLNLAAALYEQDADVAGPPAEPWQLTNVKTQADLDTIVAFEFSKGVEAGRKGGTADALEAAQRRIGELEEALEQRERESLERMWADGPMGQFGGNKHG